MKKVIVVMDLGRFKAYRVVRDMMSGAERIELIEHYNPEETRTKLSDQLTDQAGRFPGPGINGAMTQGERHDLLLETRRRVLRQLTDRLHDLLRKEGCDHWYLGASKEINPRIVEGLDPEFRTRLRKNLAADLTRVEAGDLLERFKAA